MKLLLSLLLLLPFAIADDAAAAPSKPEPVSKDEFLDTLNNIRRETAKQYNVPNMHQLIWSDDLANILAAHNWDTTWGMKNIDWRYSYTDSNETFLSNIPSEVTTFMEKSSDDRKKEIDEMKNTYAGLECVEHDQKLVACDHLFTANGNSWLFVCFFGLEGTFKSFDLSSTSAPGSKCSENYKNEDGLCVPIDPSKVSFYGNTDDFMRGINSIRKKYAKEYNVPNMHQLIWSEELVKHPGTGNGAKTWIGNWIVSPLRVPFHIEETMKSFLSKNENERQNDVSNTANYLSFLHPLQKFIGCRMPTQQGFSNCMLGPAAYNEFFDVSMARPRENAPGSKCSNRYKNQDGLCVPNDLSKVSFLGNSEDFLMDVNELRTKYAEEYGVSDMKPLVWNETLVDIAKPLNWDHAWPQARNTWRYVATVYSGIIESMYHKMEVAAKQTSEEWEARLAAGLIQSLHLFELLSPLQTQIGCALNKATTETFMLCLVGNEGGFELWDFANKKPIPTPAAPTCPTLPQQPPQQSPQQPSQQSQQQPPRQLPAEPQRIPGKSPDAQKLSAPDAVLEDGSDEGSEESSATWISVFPTFLSAIWLYFLLN